MVSSNDRGGSLITNKKLSSVGPGRFSGPDIVHEPNGMDLAMKLHYVRLVYYFPSQAFEGLTVKKIKEPLFTWFNLFYVTCGRFRRSESGRPCIKCNDCGVRFIEAQCEKTLDEWLEMKDDELEKQLFADNIIGPELQFSPLVFMQYSRFKCGGTSVGISWAHVLGDVFSVAECMIVLEKVISGSEPQKICSTAQSLPRSPRTESPKQIVDDPFSIKRVDPVGDKWITVNNCKLDTFSFHVTPAQMTIILSKISATDGVEIGPFESLCAVFWRLIAQIRPNDEPKVVTICQKDETNKADGVMLSNTQKVSSLQVDFSIAKANHGELAAMLKARAIDERRKVEDALEREKGVADFIVYGANLTFANFEDANFYGFEYQGQKPVCVSCTIDGVGDNGAVLVLPGPKNRANEGQDGRIVTVILPENEVLELKSELKREWSIA